MKKQELLDERNPIWYKIIKILIIITAVIFILTGLIIFISIMTNFDPYYGEGIMAFGALIGCTLVGVIDYAFGMMFLNYVGNVSRIRELMENNQ